MASAEVSSRAPSKGTILMVHGLWCTGEIWNRMAAAFRAMGWRVETPTFRAGLRPTQDPPAALTGLGLSDYVADMEDEARRLAAETGRPPVIFGHSMGALVAQKLAERGVARAAVLLAPTAPAGTTVAVSLTPLLALGNVLFRRKLEAQAIKVWPTGFQWGFLNCVPRERRAEIYASVCYDAGAILHTLLRPERDPHRAAYVDERRIGIPMLTVGARKDRVNSIRMQRRVAERYRAAGGEYVEYPDHAHWIVDEPGTDRVVTDIAAWLDARLAAAPAT